MIVRDIMLQANSYPETTPAWAMERAAELAAQFSAKVTFGVCQVHIPLVSNWLANSLLNIDGMIADENKKSIDNLNTLVSQFTSIVPEEYRGEAIVIDCPGTVTPWQLAVQARVHDLIVVPVYDHGQISAMTEGLVFESGRPVLLLPAMDSDELKFDRIVVAWDGSRVAARALADALPFCRQAQAVSIVQVTGEKDLSKTLPLSDVVRHLALHDVAAEPVEIALEGQDAAATLQSYCERVGSKLLVMGAFGHSRTREFVFGGVTRSILNETKSPVLISH